jgi:hypothetical protein
VKLNRIVVVGGSIAALTAVDTLRVEGFAYPPALLEWHTSGTAYRVVALNYGIRPAQLKRLVPAHHQ